ncbi:proteasome subunit beta type-6 [Neodiprion virginianus]|uniref:proteasome endopeptidase complex n=1 Tax=Neodiprion lecontei TaxID=441921 RepID=A0A6J0BH54_NEOLC|nr:proteasome subunit beta type-6 [Neodiprion lecontei]XP_046419549.1 proteasome subunit beta type-6 [Neodiprion fabricii]XP_046613282.1 proteasome subunit beta type-6 [Neodiprion virginianus]
MAFVEAPFQSKTMDSMVPDWLSAEHSTGTSIMACEFEGGVVIGADSRTTTGAYIANRVTDKLTKVTDHIYCCRSGSAADTQAISDIVSYHLAFHQMELGEPPLVETSANVFRELCYNYRDSLMAGILVAGWDRRKGGQVYSIPLGGMCVRQPIAIGGSGSSYVYGYVDAHYKPNMTKDQTIELVSNTLSLAMSRDGSSGGVVRLGVITKEGVERRVILGNKLPQFYEG